MEEYHNSPQNEPPDHPLADRHREELETGSGIDFGLIAQRGYRTASASEVRAVGYSGSQVRSGLLIPLYGPTGEISYHLKPDNPRPKKNGEGQKYETRAGYDCILDVHPSNYYRLLFTDEPFIVTEGAKKIDAAASQGYLGVSLSGVWNWGRKRERGGVKYGRPELLPDWDHIPMEGRTVYLCFDKDYREKQNVALALLRLAERLTERGAHVYIMNLPGPDKGLDDYIVASEAGSIEDLITEARPFTHANLIPYAAKQDQRIHKVVATLYQQMSLDEWHGWDATANSLLRTLLECALIGGRYQKDTNTVDVIISRRELQQLATIGSSDTLTKNTAKLEERGYLTKVSGDRRKGKANRYILKLSKVGPVVGNHVRYSGLPSINGPGLDNLVPHLRWSGPTSGISRSKVEEWHSKVSKLDEEDYEPENPYHLKPELESIYAKQCDPETGEATSHPRMEVETASAVGKKIELAIHLLLSWGGEGYLRDLSEATGVKHTTKLRAQLERVEGVFELDPKGKHGGRVRLSDGWRTKLDEHRERGGEIRRSRQQAVKTREARQAFHADIETDREPELMGPEKVEKIMADAEEREHAARIERQRRIVGMTAAVFIEEHLDDVEEFAFPELRQQWMAISGDPDDLWLAVKEFFRFIPAEAGDKNGPYVARDTGKRKRKPPPVKEATVTPITVKVHFPGDMPPKGEDGIYHHGPECDCWWCI